MNASGTVCRLLLETLAVLLIAAEGAGSGGPPGTNPSRQTNAEHRIVSVAGRNPKVLERERVLVERIAGRRTLIGPTVSA
jgi:hypothetical protein